MVSAMHLQSLLLASSPSSKQLPNHELWKGLLKNRCIRPQIVCCKNNPSNPVNKKEVGEGKRLSRRHLALLLQSAAATISLPSLAFAAPNDVVAEEFRMYSDEMNKFKIMIPQDWEVGLGENNGYRSLFGFYPTEPSESNVTVVITGLGADFTKLESFGKVDEFAENLVSGLDRSWQRPAGVKAILVDSKSSRGLYYIEYTLQKPGESRRHLYSVLGIANNGWNNRLYTVTGQFVDEDAEKYGSKIEKAVASFRLV